MRKIPAWSAAGRVRTAIPMRRRVPSTTGLWPRRIRTAATLRRKRRRIAAGRGTGRIGTTAITPLRWFGRRILPPTAGRIGATRRAVWRLAAGGIHSAAGTALRRPLRGHLGIYINGRDLLFLLTGLRGYDIRHRIARGRISICIYGPGLPRVSRAGAVIPPLRRSGGQKKRHRRRGRHFGCSRGYVPPRDPAGEAHQQNENPNAGCFFYSCHIKYLFPGAKKKKRGCRGSAAKCRLGIRQEFATLPPHKGGRLFMIRRPGNPHKEYHNVFRAF